MTMDQKIEIINSLKNAKMHIASNMFLLANGSIDYAIEKINKIVPEVNS